MSNDERRVSNEKRLSEEPLALEPLLAHGQFPECGGMAVFAGTIRDHNEGKRVVRLRYTAYAPLAGKLMREIEAETRARFGVPHYRVVHRLGMLEIGDVAIYCVARAPHRGEAFAACRHAVDAVKHTVPIWKEEFYADGSSAFVHGCCIRPAEKGSDHFSGQNQSGQSRLKSHGLVAAEQSIGSDPIDFA